MPTADEILNGLAGINGFDVVPSGVLFDNTERTVYLTLHPRETQAAICNGCGREVITIKDRRLHTYRDLAFGPWRAYLVVDQRRVDCPLCGVRTEEVPFADLRSHYTRRFEAAVFSSIRDTPAVAVVARRFGLSWDEAAHIETKLLEKWERWRGPLQPVSWMGVDEIYTGGRRGRLYTIVTDLKGASVIGMVSGHQKGSLDAFFQTVGARFCKSVEVACVDMWKAYSSSIKQCCPNAKLIFDKFHIIQHLNKAMDEVRRSEFFRKGGAYRDLIRGKRWLMLRRWFNLTRTEKGFLHMVFKFNQRLNVAHFLKEMFGQLWMFRSRTWALKFLARWERLLRWQRLKPFRKFLRMVKKHLEGILNYCDVKAPMGLVEAINGKIKSIIRQCRGFLDEHHAALKIMFLTDNKSNEFFKLIHT